MVREIENMQIVDLIHTSGLYWEIINYGNQNKYLAMDTNLIAKATNLIVTTKNGTELTIEMGQSGLLRD